SLWYIRYPVLGEDAYLEIATTRPETMLGDTAVAVNPKDKRYARLVGKTLVLPLVGREIPVIADEYVEMEFGTGAVKITPAHDPNDFEVGLRHNLEEIKVLNDDGTINKNGGKYEGLDRYKAREAIVADLEKEGFLIKTEKHNHNVGECYRCGTTVEPITSNQWFVKMKPLAKEAIRVVKDGTIKFIPERFSKIYLNWMENVHDWCISRQLWWGHRIPAYYCKECGKTIVSRDDITACDACGGEVYQDEDVLDTWFSSALWPFSTLGWPDETDDLKYWYPTSVLVTAYDIIFFWVARMIFSGMEQMKKEPFKNVFIHGLVRDSLGRKMSKSLGNGIDPLEIIEKYGADALRLTLATGNSPGNDMRFYLERVEASRNFANKLWNASRFVMMNLSVDKVGLPKNPQLEDKWILSRYNSLVLEVTENLEKYEIGIAVSKLYDFIWDVYCDWYIELVKPRLYNENCTTKEDAQKTLSYVLSGVLKLLHPIMPFITEEIYRALPVNDESIVISEWPQFDEGLSFPEEEAGMSLICEAIRGVRNIRAEMNIHPSKKSKIIIVTKEEDVFGRGEAFFKKLAFASEIIITDKEEELNAVSVIVEGAKLLMPLDELVDRDKELERLTKEKKNLESEIKRSEGKLSNQGFLAKAPAKLIEEEKAKYEKYKEMLKKVIESIENLT
ncbi:MAG TPA: valine--tRNA ligase, partial [Candidatus Moranbacteria bacterium]|nr:valine--tRNA ligase [Candidatus Moranbacteria bacterium]